MPIENALINRRVLLGSALGFATLKSSFANENVLIERIESKYSTILMYRRGDYVTMTFGYNRRLYTESIGNVADELELPVPYTRFMTTFMLYPKEVENILEIGLGGGTTAWYLHKHMPDLDITSVELDPKVVEMAKKYFHVRETEKLKIEARDGRVHMIRNKGPYSAILVDAYRGQFVPFHMMTVEFYELAKSRLAPGGVLVQNVEPKTMLFDASVATLRQVFDQVEFYLARGNVVTVAYDGPQRTNEELLQRADTLQAEHRFRYALPELLDQRRVLNDEAVGKPLTDDFAPVETLRAIDNHNRKWVEP